MDPPLGGSTALSHNEFQSSEPIEPQEASSMKHEMHVLGIDIGRCCRAVDLLLSHRGRDTPIRARGAMITQVLHCPYCHETDTVRHGLSPEGKQRYRCRACREGRGRTFLLA